MRLASFVQYCLENRIEQDMLSRSRLCDILPIVRMVGYERSTIVEIGPSYENYGGSFTAHRRWVATLTRNHQGKDLEQLRMFEDGYGTRIMNLDKADLARISEFGSHETPIDSHTGTGDKCFEEVKEHLSQLKPPKEHSPQTSAVPSAVRFAGTNLCTGLVPASARPGDTIVQFYGCSAAIVMRSWQSPEKPVGEQMDSQCT